MFYPVVETYSIELRSGGRLSQIDYELAAFALCREGHSEGMLGDEQHFVNAAEMLWPLEHPDGTVCTKSFIWNEQARLILREFCANRVVAVTGHASSTKTATAALWALVNVFARPKEVMCICVSTDIEGATQSRIYGQIQDFFYAISGKMSFKLNQAARTLSPFDPNGLFKFSKSAGIKLVSGNANKERESAGKIQGYKMGGVHPGTIILIIDEGTDVAAGLYNTFYSNLSGNRKAQLIALANFKHNNAFADLAEPEDGWGTVTKDDYRWKTKRGVCLHLNGLHSPNWVYHLKYPLATDNPYPFMQNWELIQEFYDMGLEDSPEFHEQVIAFPAPVGVSGLGIYDPAEIAMYSADQPVMEGEWKTTPIPFAGCDPAFSEGGDKAIFCPGRCGFLLDDTFAIEALEPVTIPIKAGEGNDAAEYQILAFMLDWVERYNVDHALVGYDSTNPAFKTLVQSNGGRALFPCPFHGAATDRIVLPPQPRQPPQKNSDLFANRVSEIWGVGVGFLRARQFRGIRGQLKLEMTIRKWKEEMSINRGRRLKSVESKREMKKRMRRKSPDTADAFFIGLDAVIAYFRLRVGEKPYDAEEARKKREEAIRRGRITQRHLGQRGGSALNPSNMFTPPPARTHESMLDEMFRQGAETKVKPGQRFL